MPLRLSSVKKTYKSKAKSARKSAPKKSAVPKSVKKYVKQTIAKQSEEKFSNVTDLNIPFNPVVTITPGGVVQYFTSTLSSVVSSITQGVGQGNRIGNEILIKKWTIRGALTFNPIPAAMNSVTGCQQLIVDVYIGYRLDYAVITNALTNLYQNGNVSSSPTGAFSDTLQWINKDVYKVLWKRSFKVGPAANLTSGVQSFIPNNDFKAVATFNVSLAKHFNKVVWNDGTSTPMNAKINGLSMWTTAVAGDGSPFIINNVQQTSYYNIRYYNNIVFTDS